MSKILLPIGDASEVLDTFYPYFRLPEDHFEVVVVDMKCDRPSDSRERARS